MNVVTTIPAPIDAVSASMQISHSNTPQHDVQLFQQTLINQAHLETALGDPIKNGIAAIEKQETQFRDAVARISAAQNNSPTTSSMLALQAEHLKMHFTYEATARVISLTTQNITELMRMQ
jgi:type III secretion system YscI/HrpB-like protein